jgi:hypothetical protein
MHYPKFNFNLNYDQAYVASKPFILKKEHKIAQKEVEKNPVIWTRFAPPV